MNRSARVHATLFEDNASLSVAARDPMRSNWKEAGMERTKDKQAIGRVS